jgi:hypothetical protein
MSENAGNDSALLLRMESLAKERLILPQEFACPRYDDCQRSRRIKTLPLLNRGNTCSMTYIGRGYGNLVADKSFRLVIIGMDHGYSTEPEDFLRRQSVIEEPGKFNPHYRGVIKTAAALFGSAGQHCFDKCVEKCERVAAEQLQAQCCVLRSIAQPNLVKCASGQGMDCRATTEMFRNCPQHLVEELRELKPDIIVFHGADAKWAFPLAVQSANGKLVPVVEGPIDTDSFPVIYELTLENIHCPVLYLPHPSHGHLGRKWESLMVPALQILRSRSLIPN